MMEKLGAPQTHLGLKNMIKEVDEDFDGQLSFREVTAGPESLHRGPLGGASPSQVPGTQVALASPER